MAKLYIGRLPEKTREADIKDIFGKFGTIVAIELKVGFGFVEYEDRRDAEDAISALHKSEFLGQRINVELSHSYVRGADGLKGSGVGGGDLQKEREKIPGTGKCYNCGGEGHWSRECSSPRDPHRKNDRERDRDNRERDRDDDRYSLSRERFHPYYDSRRSGSPRRERSPLRSLSRYSPPRAISPRLRRDLSPSRSSSSRYRSPPRRLSPPRYSSSSANRSPPRSYRSSPPRSYRSSPPRNRSPPRYNLERSPPRTSGSRSSYTTTPSSSSTSNSARYSLESRDTATNNNLRRSPPVRNHSPVRGSGYENEAPPTVNGEADSSPRATRRF